MAAGFGHPVAVVAVMQRAQRAVDRGVQADDAARAEIDHGPPRLMHRAVADQNEIGARAALRLLLQDVGADAESRLLLRLPTAP